MSTEPNQELDFELALENDEPQHGSVARRGVFAAAAGGVAAALFAANRSGGGSGGDVASAAGATPSATGRRTPQAAPAPRQAGPSDADLTTAGVAASLEVLAVNTYGAALDAATSGALGAVPPAVAEYVTTAKAHHQAALDAWNGVLTGAGRPAVTAPPADLAKTVNDQFGMVSDIAGAAQLALTLEQIAAATYLKAIGSLESPAAIALAGSIQPIDRQHISVLLFALGMYPVPEVFAPTDMAYAGGGAGAPVMPATR